MKDKIIEKQKELIAIYEKEFKKNGFDIETIQTYLAKKIRKLNTELSALKSQEQDDNDEIDYDAIKIPLQGRTTHKGKLYPVYDKQYIDECIRKAKPNLSKIKDVDKYLDEIKSNEPDKIEKILEKYNELLERSIHNLTYIIICARTDIKDDVVSKKLCKLIQSEISVFVENIIEL